jgi:hypothetical protein
MKKLLILMAAVLISSTASAQLISSKIVTKQEKKSNSGMILELGIGSVGGSASDDNGNSVDIEGNGVSVDVGLGYRKVFSPYVAWDIFKLRAFAEVENLGETVTPQLLTALRGTSPVLFGNVRIYSSIGLGYGYVLDVEAGGLCVEFQAGVDLTPHVYLGLVYSSQKFSQEIEGYNNDYDVNYNFTFTGLRLGFKF